MKDPSAPLISALVETLAATPVSDKTLAAEIEEIRQRLTEPLRVVLAGRVSSGKSTLLNALLGQRVAPTDVSECTQVVTWFRYGFPELVEVRMLDGTTRELGLDSEGRLPRQLGVPIEAVKDLVVRLTNETLNSLTLVDTPGFSSGQAAGDDARDRSTIMDRRSREAASGCDAMVFVFNQNLKADELEVLRAFQAAQPGPTSAVNAVAALTKADKLTGPEGDPLETAAALAKRYAERYPSDVCDVVPVLGLVAETAESAALTEIDVAALQRIAEMDQADLASLLASVDRFTTEACPVAPETREELLADLDLFGIERAIALIRGGARTAGSLRRELSTLSGIGHLRGRLLEGFAGRGVPLRLLRALDEIWRISYNRNLPAPSGQALRDVVERVRLDPAMHQLRELEAFGSCCRGDVVLPAELEEDFRRLVLEPDPVMRLQADRPDADSLRQAAEAGAARWRAFRLHARPEQDKVARVALRSYQLALSGATAGESGR